MQTIYLAGPWTINSVSVALQIPVEEVLKRFREQGAPPTINRNSTVDEDLAKLVALKYCIYLERVEDDG